MFINIFVNVETVVDQIELNTKNIIIFVASEPGVISISRAVRVNVDTEPTRE